MSGRFTGFVITHRRSDQLARTIETILAQTRPPETLLVVDNGGTAETERVAADFAGRGVEYLDSGGNLGPAGAGALALERLAAGSGDWIYWGDDDDPPRTEDTFERLLELGGANGEPVGALGAVGALWDWSSGRLERLPDERLAGALEVDMVAGGSQWILSAAAVSAVGLPEARFFFGLEDLEYCLRLRRAGYRILVDGELMRTYRELTGRLNLAARPLLPPNESPAWRQYYSSRNCIFMMRRTFDRPALARRQAARALVKGLIGFRHGPQRGTRLVRLLLRAILDGYRGRLGRTVTPPSN